MSRFPNPPFFHHVMHSRTISICKVFAVWKAAHIYYSTLSQKIPSNTIFLHSSKNKKKKTLLRLGQVLAVLGFTLKTPDLTLLSLATLELGLE